MTTTQPTNKLINATSPYLLQHAHNPVAWEEWGAEALERATKEDKPILVSIGYSSCHWCHVMEHESFENADIAAIMNEHFICIKVDREERPDIDQIYMEAVQALGINGGWPLNVFLTPQQKPFYGGTYFPSKNWVQLLTQLSKAFEQRRDEINQSAEELANHLNVNDLQRFGQSTATKFQVADLDKMFDVLEAKFDNVWGGMDKAPKFVMPSIWLFLLRYYTITKKERALEMVNMTLTKMALAGLYDQVGGGFARYSVDGEWFAPHFEKMMYDNAQLLSLYSEAFALTKNQFYKEKVYETVVWLKREMTHQDGGFYSALDADSEGVEGKFYTWTLQEIKDALGEHSDLAIDFYQIEKEGNWEHDQNILIRKDSTPNSEIANQIKLINDRLLSTREKRTRPGLDDKILAGWNAMTISGLVDAYKAFSDNNFLQMAEKAMSFIENNLIAGKKLYRSFKKKHSTTEAFLEDYAFLIQAYINLYQVTFNEDYLSKATTWCVYVEENFYDKNENYFHFTGKNSERLIARKKELFDNVIPGSNSVMARTLFALGTIMDNQEWITKAHSMLNKISAVVITEPSYMSNWGILLTETIKGFNEVVIMGKDAKRVRKELHEHYQPFSVLMGSEKTIDLPLLRDRSPKQDETMIYVCYQKTCKLPVTSVEQALSQLE
jgi:uncharacterized protein YyaL (SSP411 family)